MHQQHGRNTDQRAVNYTDHRTSMAFNLLGSPDHIPDLVIDNILKRLPTKVASQVCFLSKQWEASMSSNPVLNIDEDDDLDRCHNLKRYSDYVHQHKRFINFLRGYSEHLDKKKLKVDKLRLHMRMFMCQPDDRIRLQEFEAIQRLVELAIDGDVKELDISPRRIVQYEEEDMLSERPAIRTLESCNKYLYWIPGRTFVNAKSLTCLKLEFMIVPDFDVECDHTLLPSLKTVSLTSVMLYGQSLFPLLWSSSSIEYVSLTACCFKYQPYDNTSYVTSSSLKCLEVKDCRGIWSIHVYNSHNLESLTFVTQKCQLMVVENVPKLKKVDICVDKLGQLHLWQCNRELKATVNTQRLDLFVFYGSLDARVSFKAKALWDCVISVSELWDEEWFLSNSTTNIDALMAFLKGFECRVCLCTRDSKALIIPKSLRKTIGTIPTPLPESCTMRVAMPNPPELHSTEYLDLNDSINWIRSNASIVTTYFSHFARRLDSFRVGMRVYWCRVLPRSP